MITTAELEMNRHFGAFQYKSTANIPTLYAKRLCVMHKMVHCFTVINW